MKSKVWIENCAGSILQEAFLRGLLLLGCGQAAIRFCPPLVIDSEQIKIALDIIYDVLVEML
jgi:4-aminobutyrate aminotransferase